MVHVGLDLSRTRLDVHVMDEAGAPLAVTTAVPDGGGLAVLADRIGGFGGPVYAAIESMNGARFVHDQLELAGWQVEIADAQKVKGLAPLACKTDKIDAWVLAELSRRDLVPAIWLPTPAVRAERERARWRLHLVRHRTALKNRIHATLMAFGHPSRCRTCSASAAGSYWTGWRCPNPGPRHRRRGAADRRARRRDRRLRAGPAQAGRRSPLCPAADDHPGIGWVLGYTIAAEIGDITRFASPTKLAGYTGLCPRVYQSGGKDHRGPLAKNGPKYLRWALIEAATHAGRHPATPSATSAPRPGWAANAAPRSLGSTWPASWPRRSGTCSRRTSPSPRQAPRCLWPVEDPPMDAPPERSPSHPTWSFLEEAIER